MKNERQRKILELIGKYDIDTQETLIVKLREEGFNVTQTTVSRDIKQMKLVKGTTGMGTYKYVAPKQKKEEHTPVVTSAISESVLEVECAGNIVVVKTLAGMANAVAVCIESLTLTHIIGTVAGDDTIIAVVKTPELAEQMTSELSRMFNV